MTEWDSFLEEVKKAEISLGNPREVWYRGHSDSNWELLLGNAESSVNIPNARSNE
jgi:hypothetical protein